MASSMNKVLLLGRVGRDPEVKSTDGGNTYCRFSMATSEYIGQGDDKKEITEWHNITVWGKQAESTGKYLHKGSLAMIEGRIQTRKWTDKEGNEKSTTGIVAFRVMFLESKGSGGGRRDDDEPAPGDGDAPRGGSQQAGGSDDDFPFDPAPQH